MKKVAVVGTGPAGLMAATVLVRAGYSVQIFEKRKSAGRKLLVAGSSGLNITYEAGLDDFISSYRVPQDSVEGAAVLNQVLRGFSPADWREFIEKDLGILVFLGTSRRWFVEGMKASLLLKNWTDLLKKSGVEFHFDKELTGLDRVGDLVELKFGNGSTAKMNAACLALGGGSWEPQETPLRWPIWVQALGLDFRPFVSSNVGFQVAWPEKFLIEAEGKPIKNVVLTSSSGSRTGDLVVTAYGLEGTPIYFAGEKEKVFLDLKPDLSLGQVLAKLHSIRENLSPIRRVKRLMNLSGAAFALVFHCTPSEDLAELEKLARRLKKFPIELLDRQPLSEAISSSGGLCWKEVAPSLMLKRLPGVFVAGEMLDWDAPTGGFLIQGCVSQGHWAGRAIIKWLE